MVATHFESKWTFAVVTRLLLSASFPVKLQIEQMSLQIRLCVCVIFPHQIATVIIRSCMHYSASWSMARDTDKIAHIIIPLLSSLALHSKELKLREMAPDSVSKKFPFFSNHLKTNVMCTCLVDARESFIISPFQRYICATCPLFKSVASVLRTHGIISEVQVS